MSTSKSHSDKKKGKLLPWATAIMLVVGGAVLAAIYWNKNVTVDKAEFSGNLIVEEAKLTGAAQITFGVHPDSLDLKSIVNRIEDIDYVKSAFAYAEPSGDLNIKIEERTPIAILLKGGKQIYVDEHGVKLPMYENHSFDLPLVYGFDTFAMKDTLKSESFAQIRDFLLEAKENEFGWITISEVAYDPEDGVVALSQENGVKLLFGNNDFRTKLENWKAFYTEVVRVKGIQSMQQVDLRFLNQVVTREI